MKQKGILIILVMLFVMVLSGCEKKSLLHVYEYPGLNDDTVIFDYTNDVYISKDQEEYDNSDAIRNRMFDFMGDTYDLVYDETKTKEFLPYAEDRYHDQNNPDLEVAFLENSDQIVGITYREGLHINSIEKLENEEDYKKIADSIMQNYIQLNDYTYTCSTLVSIFEEKDGVADGSFKTLDYFYKSNDETETPVYTFSYTKYLNGIPTFEIASITLNPEGDLCSLQLNAIGLVDSLKNISLDEQNLDEAFMNKMKSICKKGFRVEENENLIILCIDKEQNPFFVVSAKATVMVLESNTSKIENGIFIVTVD